MIAEADTGIGKTFISVFHAKHYGGKVLFLAHLKDILGSEGAEGSFKKGWPENNKDIGFLHGEKKEFNSSLFTLGNRLGDGTPAEVAFAKVAQSTKGQKTSDFFRIVNNLSYYCWYYCNL